MRTVRTTVWTVTAVLLAGCSGGQQCTLIGAQSGISVDVGARDALTTTGIEVCVADRCHTAEPRGEHLLWATVDTLTSTDPVPVEVREPGRVLARTTVTPSINQPNGPHCDPTAYQASVTLPPARP